MSQAQDVGFRHESGFLIGVVSLQAYQQTSTTLLLRAGIHRSPPGIPFVQRADAAVSHSAHSAFKDLVARTVLC